MVTAPMPVADAYAARYPTLRDLANELRRKDVRGPKRQAAWAFVRAALRLETPKGVSPGDVVWLATIAEEDDIIGS
jgi:hypothetical protein